MTGYQAYKYYLAVKLHFTSAQYDVFEYSGKIKTNLDAYGRRNDKKLFEKLASKFDNDKDIIFYFVANFAYGNKNMVYDIDSMDKYKLWVKRKESRTQTFRDDLQTIVNYVEKHKLKSADVFSIENSSPVLLKLYLSGEIGIETMVMIQHCYDYITEWEPMILLWHDYFFMIKKLTPFVKFDKNRVQYVYDEFVKELKIFDR